MPGRESQLELITHACVAALRRREVARNERRTRSWRGSRLARRLDEAPARATSRARLHRIDVLPCVVESLTDPIAHHWSNARSRAAVRCGNQAWCRSTCASAAQWVRH